MYRCLAQSVAFNAERCNKAHNLYYQSYDIITYYDKVNKIQSVNARRIKQNELNLTTTPQQTETGRIILLNGDTYF